MHGGGCEAWERLGGWVVGLVGMAAGVETAIRAAPTLVRRAPLHAACASFRSAGGRVGGRGLLAKRHRARHAVDALADRKRGIWVGRRDRFPNHTKASSCISEKARQQNVAGVVSKSLVQVPQQKARAPLSPL